MFMVNGLYSLITYNIINPKTGIILYIIMKTGISSILNAITLFKILYYICKNIYNISYTTTLYAKFAIEYSSNKLIKYPEKINVLENKKI